MPPPASGSDTRVKRSFMASVTVRHFQRFSASAERKSGFFRKRVSFHVDQFDVSRNPETAVVHHFNLQFFGHHSTSESLHIYA